MFTKTLLISLVFSSFNTLAISSEPPEVYFSPKDQVADRLISLIANEKTSIKAAVYCFMHRGIAEALRQAKERGVAIEIIVDPFSVKRRSPIAKMEEKGIAVYVWDPQHDAVVKPPLMHDKFCVFGTHTVWTGSFNFTMEATRRNCENSIVLHDASVAAVYLKEFERIKKEGCRFFHDYLSLAEQKKVVAKAAK